MAWTDYFPIVDDELISTAMAQWSIRDEEEFNENFGVSSVQGRTAKPETHILALSLFFETQGRLTSELSAAVLQSPIDHGIYTRKNPWNDYVSPLLRLGPTIVKDFPNVTIRVYLSQDLRFLKNDLEVFAEVHLMNSSSIYSAPGMFWRLLALQNLRKPLTILDADSLFTYATKMRVTEALTKFNVSSWRCPVVSGVSRHGAMSYRTSAGCFWGCNHFDDFITILKAFRWAQKRKKIAADIEYPLDKTRRFPLYGSQWPFYGCDEYFYNVCLYPRLAERGFLTFLRKPKASYFLPLDIEYATWANPNSTIEYEMTGELWRGR